MPLTVCIECNGSISASASRCPNPTCSTFEPFGVTCELCGERLRRSTGVTSARREKTVHRGDLNYNSGDFYFYWHVDGEEERDIVAHVECLERFYTPPATIVCPDCGLRLSSTTLGFTAVGLWSGTTSLDWDCPTCGAPGYLDLARCRWAPEDSRIFRTPLGADPCMRPLYSFQVEPNGHGHGAHPQQERLEAEQKAKEKESNEAKARADRAFREKARNENRSGRILLGGFDGGLLGLVVGFFVGCNIGPSPSLDLGAFLATSVLGVAIGAAIGYGAGGSE